MKIKSFGGNRNEVRVEFLGRKWPDWATAENISEADAPKVYRRYNSDGTVSEVVRFE